MAKLDNTVSTKVADSTLNRIEAHADSEGMSRSEAVRDLVRSGLDDAEGIPGAHVSYGFVAGAFGISFGSAGYAGDAAAMMYVGLALLAVALAHDASYALGLRG
jgi:hypothetical protein